MGYLSKTFCSNAYCPSLKVDPDQVIDFTDKKAIAHALKLNKSEALRDTDGNYWCMQCKWRADVLDWGKAHDWPAITCLPYAIAQGGSSWNLAVKLGIDAYVQTIADAIQIAEEV